MFQNYIDIDNLEYLPEGDIEVAIKKIIFDIDATVNYETSMIFIMRELLTILYIH